MNIKLHLDDANWTSYFGQLRNALKGADTLLKKAVLIVWPKESVKHFDQEMGPEGRWAPWKNSTRQGRILHEISKTTAKQRAFARTSFVRPGGKLLQVSGRLRTETTQEPEIVQFPNGLKVVSPTPYSGYLDEGTSKMQARPFMWLGDEAQENLASIFLGYIPGDEN